MATPSCQTTALLVGLYIPVDLITFADTGAEQPQTYQFIGTMNEWIEITGYLATIARQGRAVGIHLILATQRPDASVLPGQIKNNIDCRACGRADNVLSQIVLDSTDAADAIPKDAQGRFLMADGIIFQGFWSDELDDWFLL